MTRLTHSDTEHAWARARVALGLVLLVVVGVNVVYGWLAQRQAQTANLAILVERQARLAVQVGQGPGALRAFQDGHVALMALGDASLEATFKVGDPDGLDRASRALAGADVPVDLAAELASVAEVLADKAQRQAATTFLFLIAGIVGTAGAITGACATAIVPMRRALRAHRKAELANRAQLQRAESKLCRLSERLERAAFHDSLTGLANRRKLLSEVERRQARSAPGGLCVMVVDLDRFKEINDAHGVRIGDAHLRHVAQVLAGLVRHKDMVARAGGDEFVLVMEFAPDDAPDLARNLANAVIEAVRTPFEIGGLTCPVGASVGFVIDPAETEAETLLADAGLALDAAKTAGRGLAVRFDKAMRAGLDWHRSLRADLERAISAREFVPFFQPKCSLETGRIEGFEVLARWHHPERGILHPAEFIDLAEEAGLLEAIDTQLLHRGLDVLRDLRGLGMPLTLSFNASAGSLRHPDWAADLGMALAMRGLNRSDVVIEVLETILIQDAEDQAVRTVQALSRAGTRVDIDDFGTGYASMSMLATLDVGGLKIDRTLVDGVTVARDRQIVEAITGLARGMGLHVTAEGVERAEQVNVLRDLGVESVQGFGISHPMPAEDLHDWIGRWRTDRPGLLATG